MLTPPYGRPERAASAGRPFSPACGCQSVCRRDRATLVALAGHGAGADPPHSHCVTLSASYVTSRIYRLQSYYDNAACYQAAEHVALEKHAMWQATPCHVALWHLTRCVGPGMPYRWRTGCSSSETLSGSRITAWRVSTALLPR